MAQPLYDESSEYEDGTVPTLSQLAKDVCTFLNWAAEPEHDERKRWGAEFLCGLTLLGLGLVWQKRFRWTVFKNRRFEFPDMK